jgi:hypothetical protein
MEADFKGAKRLDSDPVAVNVSRSGHNLNM